MRAKLYDLSTLQDMLGNDRDELKELIELFRQTVPDLIHQMNSAWESNQCELLGKLNHKLKSTVRLWQISSLENAVLTIEAKCIENCEDAKVTYPYIQEINEALPVLLEQLKTEL